MVFYKRAAFRYKILYLNKRALFRCLP